MILEYVLFMVAVISIYTLLFVMAVLFVLRKGWIRGFSFDLPSSCMSRISDEDLTNLSDGFWALLQECEVKVHSDGYDPVLRHHVEQYYLLWNRIHGTNLKPRWKES